MQIAILDYLREKPQASRKKMLEDIKGISEDGIKYNLKALQEKGLLKRIGADYGGYWEVIAK